MSEPKISVHILARENDELGRLFFQSCLQCLVDAKYAHQIIIVDNGCSDDVKDMVWDFSDEFEKFIVITDNIETKFDKLRNSALNHTASECTHMHWIDSDECYPQHTLEGIKNTIVDNPDAGIIHTWFWHFMLEPDKYQLTQHKDNIFNLNYRDSLKWEGYVHEKLLGIPFEAPKIHTNLDYLHFGYIRPQWQQAIKWIKYEILVHGHANLYREYFDESHNKIVDYYSDERTPDQCLDDRKSFCQLYEGEYPESFKELILNRWINSGKDWEGFLEEIVDNSVWKEWQEDRILKGSWKDTIGWICKRIGMPERIKNV